MKIFFRIFCIVMLSGCVHAQIRSVTISEPGSSTLEFFEKSADEVMLVHVLAGDAENYKSAVYQAKVLTVFKGSSKDGQTIFFGPFVGGKIGWDYLLFLKHAVPVEQEKKGLFGDVSAFQIMRDGYGLMEVSYECGFGSALHCDYGIRVCTDYVKLPRSAVLVPDMKEEPPFGCRWALKSWLLSQLEQPGKK